MTSTAWEPVIRAIEAQRPSHPTYAGQVGEAIRRVGGVMPGRFVRGAIGDRLGLRTWIGLPAEARDSVAWGGDGDARARELTLALGHALGA